MKRLRDEQVNRKGKKRRKEEEMKRRREAEMKMG
jgi:hypothetical protein